MPLLRHLSPRRQLRLRGPDRARFLHGILSNDILGLRAGAGCPALLLTVKGRVAASLAVYVDEDAILLDCDEATGAEVARVLERHLLADDVVLEDESAQLDECALYGSDAALALERELCATGLAALPAYHHRWLGDLRVAAAPDLGLPGFHLLAEGRRLASLTSRLAVPVLDDHTFEIMRIEAGRPRWGADVDESRLPFEARLDDAISLKKGCYLGQEVVTRLAAQGLVQRRLMGLKLAGETAALPGTRLASPARTDAGQVTSSVVSPRLGPIALAYVHRTANAPGTELELEETGGGRPAVVCDLPFG